MKRKSNRKELYVAIFFVILGLLVIAAGAMLLYYAYQQIVGIGDIDVNSLFRSPANYLTEKKAAAKEGLHLLVPGLIAVLIGESVVAISCARCITIESEGKKVLALEKRIEKLEKQNKA